MAIKRVRVDDLRTGMYVHDLNCGWLDHGFLRQRFSLRHAGQIQKMKDQGLHDIYIDTDRGEDVASAPTQEEIERDLNRRLKGSATGGPALTPPQVPQREESAAAKRILSEATNVIEGLLLDARFGKQVDFAKARPLVKEINASVLRNPGALISLSRIKLADTYTFQHSVSICALLVSFTHALGMDAATVEEAGLGGLLHDLGKSKIPNEILNKPGKLTEDEFTIIKSHVAHGGDLLADMPGISQLVIQIAGEHHEKVGGGGYPRGLAGDQISQIGRMAAIVDVYDALTSDRVYHKGKEPSEVLKRLLEWSGSHLDGELVELFIRALGIYPVGSLVRLTSNQLAVVVEQGDDLLQPTVRVIFDIGRKRWLHPVDLSLARTGHRIMDYEDPVAWKVNTGDYL
ncbi:MAG TPA: HD-GYP domain-containing protein [Geothrix sp.]|jgi:putative nucleotidyltransferase with HDIG domain